MGIEEQIDKLIDLGEDIKSRLDRLVELASDHFAGADKMVADEPPKKWRILHPGESVRASDWENEDLNSETDPPDGPGWRPASMWKNGRSVLKNDKCIYARPVADEPAKDPQPEHPAGPKPDPGEGYRILSKDPLEDLTPGDEFENLNGEWIRSWNAETTKKQGAICWYRRKIEVAKEPVDHLAVPRISPGEWLDIRDAYRDATPADVGKLVYVRNGELEPWIELRLAEVTGADFPYRCTKDGLDPTMWQAFRYACIRNEKPKEPQAAWEPKVGDWVRVTRPSDWEERDHPCWAPQMHQFDGKVGKIESEREGRFHICGFAWHGLRFVFHRNWLSPADPPASDKPAEPEYREPVLPADCGRICEFSSDGKDWTEAKLRGYAGHLWQSVSSEVVGAKHWVHARIKVDA